jgi:hypothetical protein
MSVLLPKYTTTKLSHTTYFEVLVMTEEVTSIHQITSNSSDTSPPPSVVSEESSQLMELTDQDVLLGRGTGPNECQGNIRFRALVRQVLQRADLSKLDGRLKALLAKEILDSVKSRNGRFLRANFQEATGRRSYVEVPNAMALDKIKQSFRHQLRVLGEAVTQKERQLRVSQGSVGTGAYSRRMPSPSTQQLGQCGPLQAAATATIQHPLDLLSLVSLASSRNPTPLANTGNTLLNASSMLPKDDMSTNALLAWLFRTNPTAIAAASTVPATNNVDPLFQGSSAAPIPFLDDSLVAFMSAFAAAKAEMAIRNASLAALQVPSASPPGIDASQLQNALNNRDLSRLLYQPAGATDQNSVFPHVSLARALALSTQSRSPPSETQSPSSMALLESLLNSVASN